MPPSNNLDNPTKILQKTPLAHSVMNQTTVTLFEGDLSDLLQSEDKGAMVSKGKKETVVIAK
ncbi:hypothetical protein PAXINDRAFT_21339 [Paxillus involutus ATCC 200175]|uniref:Unplaced genomic scaffold PAXINscaffold_1685, whole genome shotgun sequence n=1 Tax=Paxillus involutus ATCC 200175 TaxID=664439 RepID=A0A0C9T1I9_PAXIN|nr:hypothetical protein PAXINDRAFT_21339 [Paxillus involutus ATCC 200175]